MLTRLLLAFQFLTVIPVRVGGAVSEEDVAGSAGLFPAVGAVQGLTAAAVAYISTALFTPGISAVLVLIFLSATNGGFHLDGLSDTFDAIAVKSTGDRVRDREKRLLVMRDSTSGPIGVASIVFALMLKYALISHILERFTIPLAAALLFLMPVFSRWSMVCIMTCGSPARKDGLGRMFIDHVGTSHLIVSSLVLFLCAASAFALALEKGLGYGTVAYLISLSIVLYLFSIGWTAFCRTRFGGLTGDTCGAGAELADILMLLVTAVWLRHFI